jgi:hypothetical protein
MSDITPLEEEINSRFIASYNMLKALRRVSKKGDFCESLGLRREYFSRYERNELAVPDEAINALSSKYQISKEWLLYNKGEMTTSERATQYAQAGRDIGTQAGRDVHHSNKESDCEQKLASALREIELLKERIKDKEQMIELLLRR